MSETTRDLKVVTVRFGTGHLSTPNRSYSRTAILSASLLTLVAIGFASLGLWRVGSDLDVAHNFVFQDGFLSHWQVWIGLAVGVQYASWRLSRFARSASEHEAETKRMPHLSTGRAAANMQTEQAMAVRRDPIGRLAIIPSPPLIHAWTPVRV